MMTDKQDENEDTVIMILITFYLSFCNLFQNQDIKLYIDSKKYKKQNLIKKTERKINDERSQHNQEEGKRNLLGKNPTTHPQTLYCKLL